MVMGIKKKKKMLIGFWQFRDKQVSLECSNSLRNLFQMIRKSIFNPNKRILFIRGCLQPFPLNTGVPK